MALVKIVYASMTGNTEEIADIVRNKKIFVNTVTISTNFSFHFSYF